MNRLHELLNEALPLWVEVTGVNPEATSFDWGDLGIRDMHKQLKETQELDENGLTTYMILNSCVNYFYKHVAFNLHELIDEDPEFLDSLRKGKQLREMLEDGEAMQMVREFQKTTMEAVRHYKGAHAKVHDLVNDQYSLAFIRRDALRAMQELRQYQFLQGDADPHAAKYNPVIYEFWNMNSLLRSTVVHPESGITLCMVKDPVDLHSFFCFTFRNGGTLTVLTDKEDWDHPQQKHMTRRPDRSFEKRAYRNHFPYDLLGAELTADKKRIYVPDSTALVQYQKQAVPLRYVKDCAPNEIIWISMMFDLIKERYWKQDRKAKGLSYTGEMIEIQEALSSVASELVPVKDYKTIGMKPFVKSDITREKLRDNWRREPTGENDWIEDRFRDQVPDEILNLMGNRKRIQQQLKADPKKFKHVTPQVPDLYRHSQGSVEHYSFASFDPVEFGTKEEVLKDREWFARHNQAQAIDALAKKEFKKRKKEVLRWYEKAVENNSEALVEAAVRMEFMSPTQIDDTFGPSTTETKDCDILNQFIDKPGHLWHHFSSVYTVGLYQGNPHENEERTCYLTGKLGTVFSVFRPETAGGIAQLAGVEVKDLPDVLQHWTDQEMYCGNSILNRLDPMDWVVANPWRDIKFKVLLVLGKRKFRNLQVQYDIPKKYPEDMETKRKEATRSRGRSW